MYQLQLLGPVALQRDGRALPLATHKVQGLLLLLALGGPAHRARLAEWLWPGLDDAAARRNLRRELARLREAGAEGLVVDRDKVLALAPEVDCDALHFQAKAAADPDAALRRWQGPPADGLRIDAGEALAEWLDAERRRLLALRRRALQASATAHAADPARALERIEALLVDDPLQEQHHREAMRLLALLGRREAALAQYEHCRALLVQELGLAPMAQTEALAEALRRGPVAPAAPVATEPSTWPAELPLVGREADRAWLDQAWASGAPILIEGEAGAGKTRLARAYAATRGAYALAQCRAADAEAPYSAFVRALRLLAGPSLAAAGWPDWVTAELAHVLPELGAPAPRVASAEERSRLQEAAVAAWATLADGSFDLVLIDDWHLADPPSRALFGHLARQRGGARLVLLLRPELDAAAQSALHALRAEAGACHRDLAPLDAAALQRLLHQLPVAAERGPVAARLHQATGGNPFFVTETLRHWQAHGLLDQAPAGDWPLPATLHEAVLARLRRLGGAAQRVLEAAALAAEPFAPALLAGACALSEVEALEGIEQALAAQLLRETGGGFAFAHDLVQEALEAALPPVRRRLVHRRLALGAAAAGLPPAEIARHWEQGGEPARAVGHRLAAAAAALALGSDEAAQVHWQAAQADGPDAAAQLELLRQRWRCALRRNRRAELLEIVADLDRRRETWSLDPASAPQALGAAIAAAQILSLSEASDPALQRIDETLPALTGAHPLHAQALLVRSQALNGLARPDEARAAAEAALALDGLDTTQRAQLHHSLVYGHFLRGEPAQALPHAKRTLVLWRSIGQRRSVAQALANLGMLHGMLGDQPAAIAALQQALAEARALRLLEQQRQVAINLADALLTLGRRDEVLPLVDEALALSDDYAEPRAEVFLRGMRVQALYQRGELGPALAEAERALARAVALAHPAALLDCASMALDVAAAAGDADLARRLLAAVEGLPTDGLEHFTRKLAFNRVRHALAGGDLAAARAALAPVADIGALQEARDRQHAAVCQAELRLAEGDAAAALALLQAWPMAGAHVEVSTRADLARWRAERAVGGATPAAHAALQARLADLATPEPLRRALEQAASG